MIIPPTEQNRTENPEIDPNTWKHATRKGGTKDQ